MRAIARHRFGPWLAIAAALLGAACNSGGNSGDAGPADAGDGGLADGGLARRWDAGDGGPDSGTLDAGPDGGDAGPSCAAGAPRARFGLAVAVLADGGAVFVLGGIDGSGTATDAVDVFDPVAGSWAPTGIDLITANAFGAGAGLVTDEGLPAVFDFGGSGPLALPGQVQGRTLDHSYFIDWASSPVSVDQAAAVPTTDVPGAFLFGGRLADGGADQDCQVFLTSGTHVREGTWLAQNSSTCGKLLRPRRAAGACSFLADAGPSGPVLVGGFGADGGVLASVDLLGADGAWTADVFAPLSVPRGGLAALCLGSILYVVGGQDAAGNPSAAVEAYDAEAPDAGFRRLASLATPRAFLVAAAVGGRILAIGGLGTDGGPVADVEVYDPVGDRWEPQCLPDGGAPVGP